jgi:hypothetical protein
MAESVVGSVSAGLWYSGKGRFSLFVVASLLEILLFLVWKAVANL